MELKEYKRCIAQPIDAANPVGERLVDDPLFDFVEDQMMKVGSLSHGDVQWDEVEHSVLKLLSEKTKDIKLLAYLLQCLHHQPSPSRFILSFDVMASFMSNYWEQSHPAPGKRGNLPRRKFFSQMAQRFSMAVDKTDFGQFDAQDREQLNQAIEAWEKAIEDNGLTNDLVGSVVGSIKSELRKAEERQRVNEVAKEQPTPSRTSTTPTTSSVDVDHSSDKATKQTLLKVASFLAEQGDGVALAIRLRRYAVWYSITALPDHKPGGETLLRGMQQDRVKDYQDKMRHPDLALWRQVEQSLTMAPYWFDGHLMSYTIAQKLGHQNWCDAIQSEVAQFLERLPGLKDLQFKGGEPFVSDAVKDWLASGSANQRGGGQSVSGDWQEKKKEALALAKEGGIAVALSMLNDGLQAANEPRDHFYWRMLSADLLHANQLNSMAKEQYQTLNQEIKTMSVTDWEPSLVEQLERKTTSE
ncbi:type VI secretion system protein TssA [Salinivibrio proteolyticus]|uniref:Type VI secretion system protein TssA n=1 Tax=Salinivibrio proteolyticus TaxID=334715 RepID=A0ABY7LKE0_9GAMM|nr:type VI secretion system protein TssA [Salinivibrio proteolyticus]WBA16794.1 type VI secretion system protein TssA [Salinivibrio proteolyticus]